MKDTLAVINFRETSSEWIMRCFREVAVVVLFICFSSTDGWRRRRRRRCAVRIWYTLYTHHQITIKFRTQSQFV